MEYFFLNSRVFLCKNEIKKVNYLYFVIKRISEELVKYTLLAVKDEKDWSSKQKREKWLYWESSISFKFFWLESENSGTKASEGILRNIMNYFVVNGYQYFSLWLFLCNFHKRGYICLDSDLEKILLGWVVMSFCLALL